MQKFVDAGELAGAVCVVGRREGVIHESAVGFSNLSTKDPAKPNTLFRIASMTKPITAIGIMILADEGKLDPNDDVAKYLPEFSNQMLVAERGKETLSLKKPARPIKLRDLLTHTSGLAAYPKGVDDVYIKRNRTLSETSLAVALLPLDFEPGTKWSYCNSGIDTLGRIIEVVSGESYEDFLKKRIFDPLEMNDTTFYPNKSQLSRLAVVYAKDKDGKLIPSPVPLIDLPVAPKHPIPAGGLVSCGQDLAKLYRMMLNKGELNGKRILSEKAVAEMTRVQTGEIKTGFVEGMGFGYGWAVVREPKGVTAMLAPGTFGHGGAFGTQGWIDPTNDVFAILLIQRMGLVNGDASPMRQALQELALDAVKK
ncbi:MAG TPA: serine hydrolase domain-containing protein [Gemmata sp.]|jgi:CubicO group peptidase (beta-lactamase class C family)|nr:serine hydrolase domain-containing protein [Gemmata sp.]